MRRSARWQGWTRWAIAALLGLLARPGHADPAAELPAQVSASTEDSDPAWQLYQEATLALAEGNRAIAAERLEKLALEFPNHPATRLALPLRRILQVPVDKAVPEDPTAAELPTRLARAELVSFQTVAGLVAGASLCEATQCATARSTVLTVGVTAGTALTLSLLGTREGITSGQTLAIDSGTAWGLWQGIALDTVTYTQPDTFASNTFQDRNRRQGSFLLGGQLLGTGAGLLIATHATPRAGQVSLATSGGLWSGVVTALALNAMDFRGNDADWMMPLLVASDVGLGAGAYLASQVQVSRSRMLLIDSAGLLGMLLGVGVDIAIEGDSSRDVHAASAALIGTLAGLGGGVYLTRNWDLPALETSRVTPALQPLPGGAMLSVSGRF